MATSSCEGEVVKCGYLTKSPSSGGRGRCKRRWFVLSSSRQDCHHTSGNGASALSSSSSRLDYYEKENSGRKGSIDLGARCLMLEDPDHFYAPGGKKRRQSTPCFNLILMKDVSKVRSTREAFASRFQLQAGSTEEKQSWLQAFQQCGVSVPKTEKETDPVQTKPTFYLANDYSTDDLEQSITSPLPVPQAVHSPTDLAATVPGGLTFASCADEDVPWSELFNSYGREMLTSSAHALRMDTAHAHSCEDLSSYRPSNQVACCYGSKESRHLFRASADDSLTYSLLDSQSEPLASNLHELSKQLESLPYIVQFNQDQVFLSCETLPGGHFGAIHKATLLLPTPEATLRTVGVRVLGSHCPEREAVWMLQQACIMAQLNHTNVATVFGLTLSQQPKLIIMQHLSKGDLQNYLLSLKLREEGVRESLPTTLLSYCQQIATGMAFLVERGCVVSTLATKYILLSEDDVCKITGVECPSYRLCHEQAIPSAMCQDRDVLRFERDVWSFGTVLYEIWSIGRSPFEGNESHKKMESLSSVLLPPPPGCPRTIYKLTMQCWNAVSVDKPTWLTINQHLQDPELGLQTEAQEGDDFIPRDGFLLGSPLESAINLYKELQLEYHQSVLLQPLLKFPSYDWTVFRPAPLEDRVRFSPSELEQELGHSATNQGIREPQQID